MRGGCGTQPIGIIHLYGCLLVYLVCFSDVAMVYKIMELQPVISTKLGYHDC